MQNAWSRVLSVDIHTIGRDDSFVNLGGASIAAMMLVSELRKIGVKIAVADVFRWLILYELARQFDVTAVGDDQDIMEIEPVALLGDEVDVVSLLEDVLTCYGIDQNLIQDVFPCTLL
jgi:aryl carrier-like protein